MLSRNVKYDKYIFNSIANYIIKFDNIDMFKYIANRFIIECDECEDGIFKNIINNRFIIKYNIFYNFYNFEYILNYITNYNINYNIDCNINIINLIILKNSV